MESCKLFRHCACKGVHGSLEKFRNSLFLLTDPWQELCAEFDLFYSDTQMCMMGGTRPKWTRLAFSTVQELSIACDGMHSHQPWGKTFDNDGRQVFATSLEAECPRKFCIAVIQCVMKQLQKQEMDFLPNTLFDVRDSKMFEMQTARIAAAQQPRRSKLPPIIPDVSSVGVFYVLSPADVPFPS